MTWDAKKIDVSEISLEDAAKETGRECGLRANVYGKWIEAGKMKADVATTQLGGMLVAYQAVRAIVKCGITTAAELAVVLKAWGRIQEKGGLKRLAAAYKVLEMVEAGDDMTAVRAVVKEFPGAKVEGVKDLGPGDLAEAA